MIKITISNILVKEKEDAHADPEIQPMKEDDGTFGEYRWAAYVVCRVPCSCHICIVYSVTLINSRLTFFSMWKILYPVLYRTKNRISTTPLEKKIIQAKYKPFAISRWKADSNTIVCVWKSKCGIFIYKAIFQIVQIPDTASFQLGNYVEHYDFWK